MKRFLFGLVVVGCGGSSSNDPPGVDAATTDGAPGFALTSTAFAEGAAIPVANSCKGANTSPPLTWTQVPSGTLSIAVVLTDMSNQLVHWSIFDIPATATSLPASIEKVYAPSDVAGAHQVSYQTTQGYAGPCPPNQHTYQLAVYPLDVAALPGATMQSKPTDLVPTIKMHQLATATLTGTFTP